MKTPKLTRLVFVSLMTLTLPSVRIAAQTAPVAADVPSADQNRDEPIVLSPFIVDASKDKGYKATNSTSATRLNTAVKDIPLNLEVITNDFLRDTGATNLREALRYSAGVVLESQSDAYATADGSADAQTAGANDPRGATNRPGDSTIKLRGFMIDQVLRDGFRRQYSADWINIDRVDVLRGPSALLYGVGSFGGVVNYIPKRPLQKTQGYLGASVGSNGLYRAEFDYTAPLGNSSWKPAYRITGAYQERGDYTQYFKEKHWLIAPSFEFKPFPNTTVLLDNEFGYSNQTGVGFQNIRSNLGNQSASPSRTAEWLTDVSGGLINNRTFRWSGDDTYLRGPFRNNIIDVTQRIGDDLVVKVGFDQSETTFDSRQIDAGAAPSTMNIAYPGNYYRESYVTLKGVRMPIQDALSGAALDPSGKYGGVYSPQDIYNMRTPGAFRGDKLFGFVRQSLIPNIGPNASVPQTSDQSMIWYNWKDYNRVERRDQVRAEAVYNLDLAKFGKHTVLAGVQYMGLESNEEQYGPGYSYTNLITKAPVSVRNEDRNNFKNPGDYSVFRFGTQGDGLPDVKMQDLYHFKKNTWDLGYYAVYQGKFWKDRVTLIGGARWDRSDARETQTYVYEQGHNPVTRGPGSPGTSGAVPTATSPQVGVSVSILPSLSVFGVYSTGVVPNPYAADGNGNILKPTKAENKEIGLKFDLFNGRLSGTISGYEITRTGQPKYIWWAPNPYKSIQEGWDPKAPNAVLASFATPDAMWLLIHNTKGLSTDQGLALAKRVWSPGWYKLLDEVAAQPTVSQSASGPEGSKFWTWNLTGYAYSANVNTENYDPNYKGDLWFPLLNLSDPQVAAGFEAIKSFNGWDGNYGTSAGHTYRFADGKAGFTNGPGASGAFVPMNDQARGWDAQFIITPNDWLQIMLNYAHVERKVTSKTYQFVKLGYWPAGWWMQKDKNAGTFSPTRPPSEAYTDVNDTSTYHVTVPDYNNPLDDSPEDTASVWLHSNLGSLVPALKGWEVGVGGNYEGKRMWFSGFQNDGNVATLPGTSDTSNPENLVQFFTQPRYTANLMFAYSTKIGNRYDWRISVNVDNVLDDQGRYGLVYASGRSARLTSSIRF